MMGAGGVYCSILWEHLRLTIVSYKFDSSYLIRKKSVGFLVRSRRY